jgi:hypothetical protein
LSSTGSYNISGSFFSSNIAFEGGLKTVKTMPGGFDPSCF